MTLRFRVAAIALVVLTVTGGLPLWHRPTTQLSLAEWQLRALPASAIPTGLRTPGHTTSQTFPSDHETQLAVQAIQSRVDATERKFGPSSRSMCIKARLHVVLGHYDEAIETLQLAASVDPDNTCVAFVSGLAFAARALADNRAIDLGTAAESFQQASERVNSFTQESLYNLASVAERLPAPHAALGFWQQAFKTEKSPEWRAEIAKNIAVCQSLLSQRLRKLQEIVTTADPEHVPEGGIDVLLQTAEADWLTDPQNFRVPLNRLANYLQTTQHDPWLYDLLEGAHAQSAWPLLAAASAANQSGRHEEALLAATQARTASAANEAVRIASSVELAYAYGRLRNPTECLAALQGIRTRATQLSYVWWANQAWIQELTCKSASRDFDVMAERMEAAEKIPLAGYAGLGLRARSSTVEPFVSLTTPMDAWQNAHESLLLFWRGVHAGPLAVNFYISLALSADEAGHDRVAALLMKEAIAVMEGHPNQRRRSEIWADWASAQMRRQQYAAASHSYQNAAVLAPVPAVMHNFAAMSEVARAKAEIADGLAAQAMERLARLPAGDPFPYLNFDYYQRLRLIPAMGSAFLATGRSPDALRYYQTAVNECLDHLKHLKDRAQRQAFLSESEDAWRGMVQTQISNGDFNTALDSWQEFRSFRDPNFRHHPTTRETAWLSYALVGNRLALWISDSSGTDFHFIEPNQITATAQRLSALLANPDSSVLLIHTLSRQLFGQLIGPVAARVARAATLIIDADAPLGNVPWSVLENSAGQPLLESHALVLSRGWYEAASHAVNQPLQLRPGLIVADPELDASSARSLPPLRDAREESFALQNRLPATKLIAGADAKLNVIRQLLPHQRLLHYAGHGVSNGGFGALVLAKEAGFPMRLFTAQQISDLDLSSTELVVLAACSTGIGEQSGSFDLSSLVRAFLEAGASRVVAARWNIDSKPTARFMTEFYTGLLNKVPPAQSLRAAALAIRSKPLTAHPYYWAAFELYGGM